MRGSMMDERIETGDISAAYIFIDENENGGAFASPI